MGLSAKVKGSAAEKAKSATEKITKTALTKNHRKYVLNDFSIVEKARILILQTPNIVMSDISDEFSVIYDLSVQVNPSSFRFSHSTGAYSVLSGLRSGSTNPIFSKISFGPSGYRGSVDIPLIYDIYDEYNARSADGALPISFSLVDETATSLPLLIQCANESTYYAQFSWGEIEHFGFLSGIDVSYNAFSKWGQPLKAEATLSITTQPLPSGTKVNIKNLNMVNTSNTGKKVLNGVTNIFR